MQEFKSKNLLFVGDLNEGTRSLMRAQKLLDIFADVELVSNTPVPFIAGVNKPGYLTRVLHKLRFPRDESKLNKALVGLTASGSKFDIVWIEKSPALRNETLKLLREAHPKSIVLSISEDDMYAHHNRSRYYEGCLPLYDIVFTTKIYNLQELRQLGARRTEFFLDSYDELLHRPLLDYSDINAKDIDVSFVGTFEPERAATIKWLGEQGIKIVVFGNGWGEIKDISTNIKVQNLPVYGEDYVTIINRSKINLGFLRKINRDEVTSRTMEIAGSKGFLLAERTKRHLELFEEGVEADFFSSDKELLEKIKFYLRNLESIDAISKLGRRRCELSGYGMQEQIFKILKCI
jgi:spore maturation protein CgeB